MPNKQPAPFLDQAKACSLCGGCQNVCPLFILTAREELSPRAKQALGQAILDGRMGPGPASDLAGLCYACGRCAQACPRGLSASDTVSELRRLHPTFKQWLWKTWLASNKTLWPALAGLVRLPPSFSRGLDLIPDSLKSFQRPDPQEAILKIVLPKAGGSLTKTSLAIFPGCLGASVRSDWTDKCAAILAGLGGRVLATPEWACCGFSLGKAGLADEQARSRQKNLACWRQLDRPQVVVFCASCRHGLGLLGQDQSLDWQPGEQEQFYRSIIPLASLLEQAEADLDPDAPGQVHYHRPCHGREGDHEFRWLKKNLGQRLGRGTEAQCCGLGGILQLGDRALSGLGAKACLDYLSPGPDEIVLTGCSGCLIQLQALAGRRKIRHWLDLVGLPV